MRNVFDAPWKSMFACSLFYLPKYCFECEKGPISRTLESEHPNTIFRVGAKLGSE